MRSRQHLLIALLALGLLIAPFPARAQTGLSLDALQIDLWPEFDQPSMLVILDGRLAAGVPLPAPITVRIPAAAGAPLAVATRDAAGTLLNADFTTAAQGDWIAVTLTTPTPGFRIEYYDPALKTTGAARAYQLNWISDYAVTAARVRVQQPVGATGLTGTPAIASLGSGEYNLTYYGADLGALTPGQAVSFSLTYTKGDTGLSAAVVSPPEFSATPDLPAPPASSPGLNLWALGAGVGGAALIGGGVYWYLQSRRAPAEEPPKRRRRKKAAGPASPPTSENRFCHACGHALTAGDVFCRNCGARVRG